MGIGHAKISIKQNNTLAKLANRYGEVNSGVGLANAALATGDCYRNRNIIYSDPVSVWAVSV